MPTQRTISRPKTIRTGRPVFAIREASAADLAAIVPLHKSAFAGFFLTSLGDRFLRTYYETVLAYPQRLFYVAEQGSQLAGFVAGFAQPQAFYRALYRRRVRIGFTLAAAVVRRPKLLAAVIRRAAAVRSRGQNPESDCELASTAVDPSFAGQGAGRLLVEFFVAEAARRHARTVALSTGALGNDHVNRFYSSCGFVMRGTSLVDSRLMNQYILDTTTPG